MSVLYRKSLQDIARRRARSFFTIATIAAAVASLSMFALPTLMDRAMQSRIAHDRLHDIRIRTLDTELTPADILALRAIPGVADLELRTTYYTQIRVGDRRDDALLVGVQDFANQQVNVVELRSGEIPLAGGALSDAENARSGRLRIGEAVTVQVEDNSGQLHQVTLTGVGRTLEYSQVALEGAVVIYAPQESVNAIAGARGVNSLEVRVDDPARAIEVTRAIQEWLTLNHPGVVFTNLPDTRIAGTWPGQEEFRNFSTLFYVGAILALISAVALVSNTMTTMVAEQRREIAIMKAIGGRRLQVGLLFLRTVSLLAIAGSLLGVALGIPLSNVLARFVGAEFLGVTPAWGIAWVVVAVSLLAGVIGTTAAAIPGIINATRLPVREGLTAATAAPPAGATRLLRAVPLPSTGSIGLRNIVRRKTRALGTVVQVGIAVGVALGFLALGVTVSNLTASTWDTLKWDVIVAQSSNIPLDDDAGRVLRELEGVAEAQPLLYNNLMVDGDQYESWGIGTESRLYDPDIVSGRWLEPSDGHSRARVAVIGRALANKYNVGVGDTLTVSSARGDADLTIVGIDSRLMNNGTTFYLPFETFQDILGRADTNAYWLVAEGRDEASVDRLAAAAEDALEAAGYPVATEIRYVEKEANLASNRTLVSVLAVMGVPIVAIGLIGLVNMMTMNVIERTREVGILRCIGASSRDITRIFRAEALAVAAAGWLLAVPAGWAIGKALAVIVSELFDFGSVPYSYPFWYPPIALVLTLVLAWLVVMPPLRRASRLRPGDALRYE
jgi:putative ABC transport system permease protein